MVRTIAATVLVVAGAGVPFLAPAQADTGAASAASLGGYTARVSASPIAIAIYEPVLPLPSSPQAEADLSFSQVTTVTGPAERATSSTLWPGAGIGDGFGTITGTLLGSAQDYPVRSTATYPGGTHESSKSLVPGTAMNTKADDKTATASTTTGDVLPAGNGVLEVASASSRSTSTLTDAAVTATSSSVAHDISVADGLIRISQVSSSSTSTSSTDAAKSTGDTEVTGLTIAGISFTVDDSGVHAGGQTVPVPGLPSDPNTVLGQLGITVHGPQVVRHVAGSAASYAGHALEITIDTVPLKTALEKNAHYQELYYQLVNGIPAPLRPITDNIFNNPQVPSIVDLGPKVVFDFGMVGTSTSGSPAFSYTLPPLAPPSLPQAPAAALGAAPTLGASGTADLSGNPGDVPSPEVAGSAPASASTPFPDPFHGLPGTLFALALLASGAVGVGFRRLATAAGILGVAGGCRLGGRGGVPNLREG